MKQNFELKKLRQSIESGEEWRKIIKEIPAINFKPEWNVKIIPPFGGAMARFTLEYNNKHLSVYLDWYDRLGFNNKPYYELYDGVDTIRYNLNEVNDMMNDIDKIFNSKDILDLYSKYEED